MTQEATIFNKVNQLPQFNYSGAEICRVSGLEKSQVSRFLNGKIELGTSKFLQLIRSMPQSFQQVYWRELLGMKSVEEILNSERVPWTELITQASYSDLEEILNAIATRWAGLGQAKEKELAGVG